MSELEKIEKLFEVSFSDAIHDAYAHARFGWRFRKQGLAEMASSVMASYPPNFIELIRDDTGNSMGFYFPKDGRDAYFPAVTYLASEGEIYPLLGPPEKMFRRPRKLDDAYRQHKSAWKWLRKQNALKNLEIPAEAKVLSFDNLLKPLPLNNLFLWAMEDPIQGCDADGRVVFANKEELLSVAAWRRFSALCAGRGDKRAALLALENGVSTLSRHPLYGGISNKENLRVAAELWREMRALDCGDRFDRVLIELQCRNTEEYFQ